MRKLGHLLLFLAAVYSAAALLALLQSQVIPELAVKDFSQRSEAAAQTIAPALLDNRNQQGSIRIVASGEVIADQRVRDYFAQHPGEGASSTTYWRFRQPSLVTASASGLDQQHYFVNSYLVGFKPFEVDALWQPLYAVAVRKHYLLDLTQYGLSEVWQNSAQAYLNTRGDCEDHALLLADWLIALGVDARVVLGTYKGDGHAWVVAFLEGEAFLLEATSKRRYRSWNGYPKALLSRDYLPVGMFNRSSFWVNTGSPETRDYSGSHWRLMSTFSAAKAGSLVLPVSKL